jgi:hypothetical protein
MALAIVEDRPGGREAGSMDYGVQRSKEAVGEGSCTCIDRSLNRVSSFIHTL